MDGTKIICKATTLHLGCALASNLADKNVASCSPSTSTHPTEVEILQQKYQLVILSFVKEICDPLFRCSGKGHSFGSRFCYLHFPDGFSVLLPVCKARDTRISVQKELMIVLLENKWQPLEFWDVLHQHLAIIMLRTTHRKPFVAHSFCAPVMFPCVTAATRAGLRDRQRLPLSAQPKDTVNVCL